MELVDFKDIVELAISMLGIIIPLVFLVKEHYCKERRKLAEQVIAYYCLQEEATVWIKKLLPNEKKVKEKLRTMAQNNKENIHRTYPNMAIREASEYI